MPEPLPEPAGAAGPDCSPKRNFSCRTARPRLRCATQFDRAGGLMRRNGLIFLMIATAAALAGCKSEKAGTPADGKPTAESAAGKWMGKAREGKPIYASMQTSAGTIVLE